MRKIATLVGIVALMTVLVMSFGTAAAVFADPPLPEGCFK